MGLNYLWRHYMSVGELKKKNNKPNKTPKKSKSKTTNPKEYSTQEQAALYQVIFPKSHSVLLHFTPLNSSHGLHGSCLLWMQAAFLWPPNGYPLNWPQVSSIPVYSSWFGVGNQLSEHHLSLLTLFVATGIGKLISTVNKKLTQLRKKVLLLW